MKASWLDTTLMSDILNTSGRSPRSPKEINAMQLLPSTAPMSKIRYSHSLFSKSCCRASKLHHLGCGQRATLGNSTELIGPIQHPFNNIKQYDIFYIAFGNFAADLYKRHLAKCIHHQSIPTRRTVRFGSHFTLSG